jgi:PPP family 3-phenylpropionic acid transporter
MICLFTVFQTSTFALSDAITLEELERHPRWSFGRIRMGGTFGFAFMAVVFGWIAKTHIGYMFVMYALVMAAAAAVLFRLPKVSGYQTAGNKMHMWVLLRNRKLVMVLVINLILQTTLGYYYSFFPVYLRNMGGDSSLLGWSMVISSFAEIPFLMFAQRIFNKFKITHILLISSLAAAARWFAFANTTNPYWTLPAHLFHGLMFIVLTVTLAMFINREVPKELKASGQTLAGLLNLGVARIIGSFVGGFASEAYGMRSVFSGIGWIALGCSALILVMSFFERHDKERQPAV